MALDTYSNGIPILVLNYEGLGTHIFCVFFFFFERCPRIGQALIELYFVVRVVDVKFPVEVINGTF